MTEKTGDLMARLTSTDSPKELDGYLEDIKDKYPTDLGSYIKAILAQRGLSKVEAIKNSKMDRGYFYQILEGIKNPSRDKIIQIAIGCEMTVTECQRALEIAQVGILYPKNQRDSLIIYGLNKKMSVLDLNCLLEEYKFDILE
ncbi:helix-turn-helix domain-containing protein [Butyrivibrio sp. AE2032]|uniref:helix-turn-helix domain-containing protein n=1 Tax=Butyrivibrio sp. AE2032 TaxID=1458463 RepID=UPI000554ABC9|nr:helix-turn-helix transcriptional regulator [Butyrivibrio sp. AE2032]